jgi:hypothetical protein
MMFYFNTDKVTVEMSSTLFWSIQSDGLTVQYEEDYVCTVTL